MSDGRAHAPRARGAQPANANAKRHGVYSLQRRLKGAGVQRVDGRSALERLKRDWKQEIRDARGGELTPQLEALLETAANTMLMLSTCDDWILSRGPIDRRRGKLRAIVEQRAKLARTLRELLSDIGLGRAPRPKRSLAEFVEEQYAGRAAEAEDAREDAGEPGGSVEP